MLTRPNIFNYAKKELVAGRSDMLAFGMLSFG